MKSFTDDQHRRQLSTQITRLNESLKDLLMKIDEYNRMLSTTIDRRELEAVLDILQEEKESLTVQIFYANEALNTTTRLNNNLLSKDKEETTDKVIKKVDRNTADNQPSDTQKDVLDQRPPSGD